ncbi:uncharacterized protein LOC123532018 [Mercenaria mercenaria]|uniref:uncharacterized protein LOC123532018 n=1 Tax=Mercenaria mercenaria TaxID=6596 RepID=UPI00234E8628|nr:uncharacterized protein LOC123532018 [Mercenaria mercenaria]
MEVLHWSCLFIIISIYSQSGNALTCLNCDAIAHPRLCTHVTQCFPGEKCGMETSISTDGDVVYNLGCVDSNTCSLTTPATQTDGHQYFSCHNCCDDHDLCNAHGCNSTGFPTTRGPICFNCVAFPEGYPCHKITHCETHEVCFNDAHLEFQTDMLYTSGCRSRHHCASETVDPESFMGRRSVSVCTDCCKGDLCNLQCRTTSACSDDPSCKLLMSSYDVCKSPDVAKQFCKKSCNLCPASGLLSCTDTRLDCAHISSAVNMCGTQQDAAKYGCLKYCGFCSGSTGGPGNMYSGYTTTTRPGNMYSGHTTTTNNNNNNNKYTSSPQYMFSTTPATTTTSGTSCPLVSKLKLGVHVQRGPTWNYGSQDGLGTGVVTHIQSAGWVSVRWNRTGQEYSYRIGKDGKCDLAIACILTPVLKVGERVERGPTWNYGSQDRYGAGVITQVDGSGWVKVRWNNSDRYSSQEYSYRVGNGFCDLQPDSGMYTTSTVATTTRLPLLHPGEHVTRGPDWHHGNQDGNGPGTVISASGGRVLVFWPSTNTNQSYQYGQNGRYEVQLYTGPLPTTTAMPRTTFIPSTLFVGDKVVRGPNWTWQTQDGNGTGTVISAPSGGWVTVKWDKTGVKNSYRYGSSGKYDVKLYSRAASTMQRPATTSTIRTTHRPTTHKPRTHKPRTTHKHTTHRPTTMPTTSTTQRHIHTTQTPTTSAAYTTVQTTHFPRNLSVGNIVIRGTDWMWGNQDNNGTGVITAVVPGGWVTVRWDKDGFENSYRYGALGKYDVKLYSSGSGGVTVPTTSQSQRALVVGDQVIRGPDWTWKDQDGNTTGVVTGTSVPGWVTVRWGNGFENTYRYGTDGKYDVAPVNAGYTSGAPTATVSSGIISVGDNVIRGPDWKYANQGGNGTGRVIGVDSQTKGTWVKVRWGDGSENFYRFGAEGKYDVIKEQTVLTTTTIYKSTVTVYTFRAGDRVVRGPDWQWGNQDNGGTGTVTAVDPTGWVTVRWDNNFENSYRNGVQNAHDLLKVGSITTTSAPRTHATTAPPTAGPGLANDMYIGARVQRGRDWKYGNQDGNGSGSVRQLPPDVPSGWVQVEWDNGYLNNYRLGAENAYDIMFVPGSYNNAPAG